MSSKERFRLELISRIGRKEVTVVKAAELSGLSVRQMRRICKRHKDQGEAGLIHRSRGKKPNNHIGDEVRLAVLLLYQEKYADFGPTLASEKLAEDGHGTQCRYAKSMAEGRGVVAATSAAQQAPASSSATQLPGGTVADGRQRT